MDILYYKIEDITALLAKFTPDVVKISAQDCNIACKMIQRQMGYENLKKRVLAFATHWNSEVVLERLGLIDKEGPANFEQVKIGYNAALHLSSSIAFIAMLEEMGMQVSVQGGYPPYLDMPLGRDENLARDVTDAWVRSLSSIDQGIPWNALAWGTGDRALDLDTISVIMGAMNARARTRDLVQPSAKYLRELMVVARGLLET